MLTAEARIRRLRRRLTALFALTSALGLVALAAFTVHSDLASRHRQLDGTLRLQTSDAIPAMSYDDTGKLDTSGLVDSVDADCPSVTVFSVRDANLEQAFTPRQPCAKARTADVRALAASALRTQESSWTDQTSEDDKPLRLLAVPFSGSDGRTTAGVLVAAADTSDDVTGHQHLVLILAIGCAVVVAVSSLVGHLLSGRATRPALTALQQQETFLADAAHDLRTPIASLRTLAETALREHAHRPSGEPQDTVRTSALERTVRLAGRMGDLVDGLLTRARLMAGVGLPTREPLRLDQLVEAVVDEAPTDGHLVTVRTEPVVVNADPDLLRRAIANLLGNALAHGHAPGVPAEVELTVTADAVLTVDDAGPGIPPLLADSLFQRFRSGSGSTGLGLSIASWVTHAHEGTLTAGRSPRGGARFTLRLTPHRR